MLNQDVVFIEALKIPSKRTSQIYLIEDKYQRKMMLNMYNKELEYINERI